MSSATDKHGQDHLELVCLYALEALPSSEGRASEAHIAACAHCQRELDTLRPIVESFVSWPTDVLRPPTSLRGHLAQRIAANTGGEPVLVQSHGWAEPRWEEVAPGISCKLLSTDTQQHAGTPRPRSRICASPPCGSRRIASAGR